MKIGFDVFRFRKASSPVDAAGQVARSTRHDKNAIPAQRFQVAHDSGVIEHIRVHGRTDDLGLIASHKRRRQKVIGNAASHLANDIGRSRCHNHKVTPTAQGHMLHIEFIIATPHIIGNRRAADFLK